MTGSGDFTNQAITPQRVDMAELAKEAGQKALNDLELTGVEWSEIPATLAKYGIDILIGDLIEAGHRGTTVGEIAIALGLTYPDGSWV